MNSDDQHTADTTPVIRDAPESGAVVRARALRRGHIAPLVMGRLPRGSGWAQRHVLSLRRVIEAELLKRHATLTVWQLATIQTTCRYEARALLLQQLLRRRADADALTVPEHLALTAAITSSSAARDRGLKALGLDRAPSIADQLFGQRGAL